MTHGADTGAAEGVLLVSGRLLRGGRTGQCLRPRIPLAMATVSALRDSTVSHPPNATGGPNLKAVLFILNAMPPDPAVEVLALGPQNVT